MDRNTAITGKNSRTGSTLVEVLVGALLVAITAIALFQIISSGSYLNRRDLLRRRSFQEMERVLENPKYSSRSPYYLALTAGNPVDTMNVVLDDRGDAATNNNLNATIKVRVDTVSFTCSGTMIPAKKVMAKIIYLDNGTQFQDSLQTIVTMTDVN